MATKDQVIDLNREHPDWTASEIAEALDCMPEYVHATAKRYSIPIAKATIRPNELRFLRRRNRKMEEALKNMIALARPHFTDDAQTLALSEATAALEDGE